MLLPSDIARLVLGYLQQEKLNSTCSAFIAESPDLKEYAEHYTDEGFVPGCLLSLFGKNLTAILNEYVSMKSKEMSNDVPAMMSSLWKKLEYTLSQIRSMQNSVSFATHQRARTRSGIADMRRHKTLEPPSPPSSSRLSATEQPGKQASQTQATTQVDLQCTLQAKSNPLFISLSSTHENRPTTSNGGNSTPAVVPGLKNRKNSILLSPGRRKSESQKRRPRSTVRNGHSSSVAVVEEKSDPLQELIDGNFPKMVIENARDRFLSNKSLQEKLAENINKFLGSDTSAAQASKPADSSAVETDTSIDEILALEGGEIHMSEEAIQDILQQTESDPAFQALFDLFDYGKKKDEKNTTQDSAIQNEDGVRETTLGGKHSNTLERSIGIEDAGERDGTSTSRNSSQNENVLKNMSVGDTNPGTLKNSLELQDGGSQGETESSVCHSGIICSSARKQKDNCVENKENGKQTTLDLHLEKENEKLGSGLPVEDSKQICEVQTTTTSEQDLPQPNQLSSPKDGSHSVVSNSNPSSHVLVKESDATVEREKESSVSDVPLKEQSLPVLGQINSDLAEHSVVIQNVEMEDVSSSKGRKNDMECEPDILNITPLSEEAYANPFVPVPMKLFRHNHHSTFNKDSTAMDHSSESGKNQQDVSEIAPILPDVFQPVSIRQTDTVSVESTLLNEVSPQHMSEEKQKEVGNESEPLAAQEALVKYVDPHAKVTALTVTMPQEPLHSVESNTNSESLSHATSTIEEGNVVTSTQSNRITSASSSHIVPLSENAFTIVDSSSVPTGVGNVPSSSNQSLDVDPSSIMSLKIIISDESSRSVDAEINNAVSSISGEKLPTIILSSPGKVQVQNIGLSQSASGEEPVTSSERVTDVVFVDQSVPVHTLNDPASSTVSFQVEDGTVFSVAGTPNLSKEGGFIQLLPATSAAFGQSNNLYIATCMPDTSSFRNTTSQSKITPIAAKTQSQSLTPPRPRNMFAVGQTLSPKVSQGSTIIFASPVQPAMLQMGMIPVSVVGQTRNTYSTFPSPLLRMPATVPLGGRGIPKLPIQPKTQKSIGVKSTSHTGRMSKKKEDITNQPPIFQLQRLESSETTATTDVQKKPEEKSFLVPPSVSNSNSKVAGSHRRVLCFEDGGASTPAVGTSQVTNTPTTSHSKERTDSLLHSLQAAVGASQYIKIMQSNDSSKTESNNPSGESIASLPEVTGPGNSISETEKDAEPAQKVALFGTSPDYLYKTSANKENELKRSTEQHKKQEATKLLNSQEHVAFCYEKTVPLVQEMSRKGTLPNILRKSPCDARKEPGKSHLISPLSKQAGEMLQDIQLRSPPSKHANSGDLPIPRTPGSGIGVHYTDMVDTVRTPTFKSSLKDEGTPKALLPPATPELPSCSPASEAGSENSVSMAAHTLMILSRASVARPGSTTPLKDNTQQTKSSRSTAKKRKLEEAEECERQTRSSKKDMQSPPTALKKKKIKKQKKKKLLDSFPAGMDVDKFLLSLHYDE